MCMGAACLPTDTTSNQKHAGGPRQPLTLPCHPPLLSPSPHTSPEECEVIAPRQTLAPFSQMFAQTAAASRKPGAEMSPSCSEGGHKAFAVPCFHPQPLVVLRPRQAGLCTAKRRGELAHFEKPPSLPFPFPLVRVQRHGKPPLSPDRAGTLLAGTSWVRSSAPVLTSHVLLKCGRV